jgi:hypothetical protein
MQNAALPLAIALVFPVASAGTLTAKEKAELNAVVQQIANTNEANCSFQKTGKYRCTGNDGGDEIVYAELPNGKEAVKVCHNTGSRLKTDCMHFTIERPAKRGADLERAHLVDSAKGMQIEICDQSSNVSLIMLPAKSHVQPGGYRCIARSGTRGAYYIELEEPRSTELLVVCNQLTEPVTDPNKQKNCKSTIVDRPIARTADLMKYNAEGFNSINDQARNTVISVPDGSAQYAEYMYARYRDALLACDAKFPDQAKNAYWAARISQKGQIVISKYVPQTQFIQCVNAELRKMVFKRPPSAKFDELGGYPVMFEWKVDNSVK